MSSAGVQGYLDFDRDSLLRVGSEVIPAGLCGLWAKQALSAAAELPQWERVVLTVDSGASDTVIPPSVARSLPLLHSSKVGIEYEVANGATIPNLRERRCAVVNVSGVCRPRRSLSKLQTCADLCDRYLDVLIWASTAFSARAAAVSETESLMSSSRSRGAEACTW